MSDLPAPKKELAIKLYQCDVCQKVFNKKSNFKRHLLIHSNTPVVRKPHICSHCGFNAATSSSLTMHIKRIHTKEFKHICSLCNKGYVVARELQRHVKNHHASAYEKEEKNKAEDNSDSSPLFEIPLDPIVVLETEESAAAPQSPPTGKPYQCELCERAFIKKYNLTQHLLTHSEGHVEKVHVCPHCHFKASSSSSLCVHIRRIHTKEFRHICPHCNKGFAIPNELRKHIKFRHPSIKETDSAVDFIKIREEGFMCEICNRLLTSLSEVEEHRKRHHNMLAEKEHHCTQCDYSTNYKGDLRRHERYHLGDRPFRCEFCDKAFVEKGALKIHLRMHTGENPFTCTTCGKRFKRLANVQEHERTHSGEKPFLCDICSRRFTSKTGFNLHKCRLQNETPEVPSEISQDFLFLLSQ